MEEFAKDNRVTMDDIYLLLCRDLSLRASCMRRKIGCVIVKNGQIVGSGVNGSPKGLPLCSTTGCLRDCLGIPSGTQAAVCRGVHAEQNALLAAGLERAANATLYTNSFPCPICSKLMIQSEIARVVVCGQYRDEEGIQLLKQAGIQVTVHAEP